MRIFPLLLAALLGFTWVLVAGESPAVAPPAVDAAAVDSLVQEALQAWKVPGLALAIVCNDRVLHLKGYGVKELGKKDPITPDSIFPIASCTKAFTTTALAMLVDQDKMKWDDPVRKHVEFFHLADPLADANVNMTDLVTHRTGLRGHELLWYRAPWSQEEMIRRIGRVPLDYPFRSKFQYQSIMFSTAGYAVGKAANTTWVDFVQKQILDPLGMTSTRFTTTAAEKAPDRASPHRRNKYGSIEVIPSYKMTEPDPAGSIHATARDLSQWVRFHLGDGTWGGKRLVSAKNLAETHTPQIPLRREGLTLALNPDTLQMSYGMAWVIHDYRGHLLISHAGAIDGSRAHLTLIPQVGIGMVLLNNLHQTRMNQALSNSLIDLLLRLPPKRDWNKFFLAIVEKVEAAARARVQERIDRRCRGTRPSREFTAYTGVYSDPAYGKVRISLKNGGLIWCWSTFKARLEHYHYDTFTVKNDDLDDMQATFTLGADGNVMALKLSDPIGITFTKQ